MKKALCFVSDKNYYYKQGRFALLSAADNNPDYDIITITDGIDEPRAKHNFTFKDLGLEQSTWLTTARPSILQFAIRNLAYDYCFLIDGDTYTYSSYDEMQRPFEENGASVLVIPHILKPLPNDNKNPSMATLRLAGNYNAGIFGCSTSGLPFIDWMTEQTKRFPHMARTFGYFSEQGWLQFAADFDEKTCIFRHPGYNVAYWNIMQRELTRRDERWFIDGEKLAIMHFSGLKQEVPPEFMSIYQDRFILDKTSPTYQIFKEYKDLVWGNRNQ